MLKLLLIAVISVSGFALEDYMFFQINSMVLDKEYKTGRLEGTTSAKRIFVSMDRNEFEIQESGDKDFVVATFMDESRFTFFKEGMKFSTPLDDDNPVLSLTKLGVSNAMVEMSSKAIIIKGDELNTNFENVRFFVSNIDMTCLTEKFSTDFENVCVKNTKITPSNPEVKSLIKVEDLSEDNAFNLEISSKSLEIDEESLLLTSDTIDGHFRTAEFSLKNSSLDCYKDPELGELDVEKIIYGCLEKSTITGERLAFKQSVINTIIDNTVVNFDRDMFSITADKAFFKSKSSPTELRGLKLECSKGIKDGNFGTDGILEGCLKSSNIEIKKIKSDSKILTPDGEKLADVNSIRATIYNNSFEFTARMKMLWRMNVKMYGKVLYDSKPNQLRINVRKATIAGVSTRSLALYFLRKIIDSSRIRVSGKSIIIQL